MLCSNMSLPIAKTPVNLPVAITSDVVGAGITTVSSSELSLLTDSRFTLLGPAIASSSLEYGPLLGKSSVLTDFSGSTFTLTFFLRLGADEASSLS